MKKHILMVVTSVDKMPIENKETGIWFSEFAEAYIEFEKNGFIISVASPLGGKAPIDKNSLQAVGPQVLEAAKYLENTLHLNDISDISKYNAIFLVGGHGTMFDFPDNKKLHFIIREMFEANKVVAAVCHGPAGLVGVTLSNGKPLVEGKKITSLTNTEEKEGGLTHYMPFLLESRLSELGAVFIQEKNWESHVESDGNLITGQNPQSTISLVHEAIRSLDK